MRLLIAVHDVTPAYRNQLERCYALLRAFGIERYALLVVPDWHGEWPLSRFPDFSRELRARGAGGAEIFLHGFRHDESGTRRSPWHHLRALGRTAGEGEFLALPDREASGRIGEGVEALRAEGLTPSGCVAPAWLFGSNWLPLLRERGLSITEDERAVICAESGRRIRAPAMRWSTRKRWRAAASVGVAAGRLRLHARRPLLRLALHPPDLDTPPVARSVERTVRALLARRRVTTYHEVVDTGSAAE